MLYWKTKIIVALMKTEFTVHVNIYFSFVLFAKIIQNVACHNYVHLGVYKNIKHRLCAVHWYISTHHNSVFSVVRHNSNFSTMLSKTKGS